MSDAIIVALIVAIPGTLAALLSAAAAWKSAQLSMGNSQKLDLSAEKLATVEVNTNSNLTQLREQVATLHSEVAALTIGKVRAEATLEEKASAAAKSALPPS